MVKPHTEKFIGMSTHDAAHLLNVGCKRFAKWSCADGNLDAWIIKPFGKNIAGNEAIDIGVWLGKIFNYIAFKRIIILVRNADKVVAFLRKLFGKVSTVSHTSTKNNCLFWFAKNFVGLFNPF